MCFPTQGRRKATRTAEVGRKEFGSFGLVVWEFVWMVCGGWFVVDGFEEVVMMYSSSFFCFWVAIKRGGEEDDVVGGSGEIEREERRL